MENIPLSSVFNRKCYFGKHKIVWKSVTLIYLIPEYGSLDFKMRAFRDSDHSEKLVSNAGPLAIGSMLCIEVEVLSADKDLQLLLERCWATASSVPTDVNQRQFVLDG